MTASLVSQSQMADPRRVPSAARHPLRRVVASVLTVALLGVASGGLASESIEALFDREAYEAAAERLENRLARQPEDPNANFWMGRCRLAQENAEQALPYFRKALPEMSGNPEIHFWLGVTYWALYDFDRELAAYREALALAPDHLPAHVYAGHNLMDRGDWEPALAHYRTVLAAAPDHAEALFNSGLALRRLGRRAEEIEAWRRYLSHRSSGDLAHRAVDYLNDYGDFSYRQCRVGPGNVILPTSPFPEGGEVAAADFGRVLLEAVRPLRHQRGVTVQIVAHSVGREELAESRVRRVRSDLLHRAPFLSAERVRVSWFGDPETLDHNGSRYRLDDSIRIFTTTDAP